jgi:PKD repeat protein
MKGKLFLFVFVLGALSVFGDSEKKEKIKNPYYDKPEWKLWSENPEPVIYKEQEIKAPVLEKRIFPVNKKSGDAGKFLFFEVQDAKDSKYAGMADDVYFNEDHRHSWIRPAWSDKNGNKVTIKDSFICVNKGVYHEIPPFEIGANFTSQSTTEMAHHITNSKNLMFDQEKYFYFADVLRAGPTHTSYMDKTPPRSVDRYEALVPSFYNSVGSSSGETTALTKMVIAGAYMPKETKALLKRNGLYPSALLYIWKAALPYDAPFDNELRHRVAYNSKGDHTDYRGTNQTEVNHFYHNYDDSEHMRRMADIAKNMDDPPPIALLNVKSIDGGKEIYSLKTAALIHQEKGQDVKIKVSTGDSFDLKGLPLTFRWKTLYGNKKTKIERDGDSDVYTITVPYDEKLPKGRTAILLVANNGKFDSNPAVINVYRKDGKDNLRPEINMPDKLTVLPGEKVEFEVKCKDPEGFPVKLYRWSGEVGELKGNKFTWKCPADKKFGEELVTIIASDECAGNSYNSAQLKINIRPAVAVISADKSIGKPPLKVKFSSKGSKAMKGPLKYLWNFGDGATSTEENSEHVFEKPGFYEAVLTVDSEKGSDSSRLVVEVSEDWKLVFKNGWSDGKLDEKIWKKFDKHDAVKIISKKATEYLELHKRLKDRKLKAQAGIVSVADFKPPLYIESEYKRSVGDLKGETGFKIFGKIIGSSGDPKLWRRIREWNITISYPKKDKEKWPSVQIASKVRNPWTNSKLRLFITADPENAGKFRFAGKIRTARGDFFFELDNQDLPDKKLEIISSDLRGRFDIFNFLVKKP